MEREYSIDDLLEPGNWSWAFGPEHPVDRYGAVEDGSGVAGEEAYGETSYV